MGTEYAPETIKDAYDRLDAARPDWHLGFGGITGNAGHTYGYHRSRNWLEGNSSWRPLPDYSIRHADDRDGDGDAGSAVDITPQGGNAGEVMATMTGRLIRAIDAGDPRAPFIAEIYGTLNGSSVAGRLYGQPASADDSHLWHVHLAGRRRYVNDDRAWGHIVDIILGEPFRYPPDHENWSDTVDRSEVVDLIRDELRAGLAAVELGGDHGFWTEKSAPLLHKPEGEGDRDRLSSAEDRLGKVETKLGKLSTSTSSSTSTRTRKST